MDNVRITNSFGETVTYYLGQLAGVDTTEPYWWLSEDKRACLRYLGEIQ